MAAPQGSGAGAHGGTGRSPGRGWRIGRGISGKVLRNYPVAPHLLRHRPAHGRTSALRRPLSRIWSMTEGLFHFQIKGGCEENSPPPPAARGVFLSRGAGDGILDAEFQLPCAVVCSSPATSWRDTVLPPFRRSSHPPLQNSGPWCQEVWSLPVSTAVTDNFCQLRPFFCRFWP